MGSVSYANNSFPFHNLKAWLRVGEDGNMEWERVAFSSGSKDETVVCVRTEINAIVCEFPL